MVVGGLSCLLGPAALAAQQPDRARQIAAAVLPLPAELRAAASMGLSTTEDGIHPYVMASGTYWAHVMIMQRPLRY